MAINLTEEHRLKLDGIVQQMIANKESDSNIQWVVNDFKQKYTNLPPEAPAPQKQSIGKKVLDVVGGTLEVPATIATGAVAGGLGLLGGIAKTFTSGDVEGKKTREEITNAFTYKPKTVSGKGAMDIIGTALSPLGVPRNLATQLGGEQYGNVADVAMIGLLPKVPGAIKKVVDLPYKGGKILFRKTLAPAGTVAETKALTETGYEGGYGSTMADRAKFYKDLSGIQAEANQIIAKNTGKKIPYENILKPLDDLINKYAKNTELPETHIRALERVKLQRTRQWLKDYPDGNIPLEEVQRFKTTLYKRAENAYGEVKNAMSSEAQKALARGAREELETVMPEIGPINRRMKPLLEFEDALDKSIVRIKNEKFSITNTIFNNDFLLGKLAKVFKALSPKHPLSTPEAVNAYLFAKKNADFDEAFAKPVINPNQIEYKPQINLGMEDISSVKGLKAKVNNPEWFSKNKDLIETLLEKKIRKPGTEAEFNQLFYDIRTRMQGGTTRKDWATKPQKPLSSQTLDKGKSNYKNLMVNQ